MRYEYFGRLLQSENGDRKEYERRRDGPLVDYVKDERGMVTRTERDGYLLRANQDHNSFTIPASAR